MRKRLLVAGSIISLSALLFFTVFKPAAKAVLSETEENEEYENQLDRYAQEFEQIKDPATGTVPNERLLAAINYTKANQRTSGLARTTAFAWQERGPIFDVVGPSNGNTRGGNGGYTAGIVQTFLVDKANDPTGNTIFAGSPSGGLWKCTNFLSATAAPNWQAVNDFQANLAIASICQDPSNPSIMYLATGDANTRDVRGFGIWKSTNAGTNWTLLPNTTNLKQSFKILCDNAGRVYLATGGSGLQRSTDGGNNFTLISPTGLTGSNPSYVSDIELSSTGRLHAIFGYFGTKAQHFYTDVPATVSASTGWVASTGIRTASAVACSRIELAVKGNLLYAVTANSSNNIDSCYKSTDGGANWTLQNTTAYPTGLGSGQTWYAVTLQINPDDDTQFIVGGLDAYKSVDEGVTVNRQTYWVSSAPYVHADHHAMQWFKQGTESMVWIGCDGGMFMSRDGGVTWRDRNQNLGIKQFYSCATNPTAGVNYLLAGAQDNGVHQLVNPGLSSSTEVTGGDGAYVYINQLNPQIQFGSYVYNQYRRSTNGGNSWGAVNFSSSLGYFINPFDYDDLTNTMYASNAGSPANMQFRRWDNANTSGTSTVFTVNELVRGTTVGNASAFKVSPYKANRVYIGGNNGKLLRLDSANTVVTSTDITNNITDLTGAAFPAGSINCINTGTSDQTLVAVFTNYGVNNVWYSNNGGTTWTGIDNNLPDMPIWWATFVPGSNTQLILGTETGVYSTDAVNGAATVWTADTNFPLVRTRMLRVRQSDNLLVAATYGRGLWTANLGGACPLPVITTQPVAQTACAGSSVSFTVGATGAGTYQWRRNGVAIAGATAATYSFTATAANAGLYDVVVNNDCGSVNSSEVALTVNPTTTITTQPTAVAVCVGASATFTVAAQGTGAIGYQWRKGGVAISGATSATFTIAATAVADAGTYDVVVTSLCGSVTSQAVTLTVNTTGGCVTAVPAVDADVSQLLLMPNAISNSSTLRVTIRRATTINWSLVDVNGRVLRRFTQKVTAGQNDVPFNAANLASGSYFLQGTTDRGRFGIVRFEKL